jgi:two-component system CheB/CheR fusion protein
LSAINVKKLERARIVAIGASAGGLEPLEKFFDAMQSSSGLSFVVIQHLSPDFESMMDELLARHSTMKIERVRDKMTLKRDTIYLNPPRTEMTISKGKFRLKKVAANTQINMPIDTLFTSLAKETKDEAVAVVLSGTGTDGTVGARAIRSAGGIVLAQDADSAKFDGMPTSVIRAGLATAVGTPQNLANTVTQIAKGQSFSTGPEEVSHGDIDEINTILRDRFGTDFNYYKRPTIERRINRRASMRGLTLKDYCKILKEEADEVELLYGDLLIEVTEFFRDDAAFEELDTEVLPKLIERMSPSSPLRVWVPGCASGEEAYSLAILIAEHARKKKIDLNLKILATDIHHRSLDAATRGIFSKNSLIKLSRSQKERYFEKVGHDYQISQAIRRTVMFSAHNLLRDPPFTRMDLVSCRNVLIYLNDVAQKKTMALFHFALSMKGYLFLGPSETTGQLAHEYATISSRWRIYQKKRNVRLIDSTTLLPARGAIPARTERNLPSNEVSSQYIDLDQKQLQREALELMLEHHAPPGFLLANDGTILHVFGDAGKLMNVGTGTFSDKIFDFVDPELKLIIATGMQRLRSGSTRAFERSIMVPGPDSTRTSLFVDMRMVRTKNSPEDIVLLVISTLTKTRQEIDVDKIPKLDKSEAKEMLLEQVRELESELAATEENLQNTIEELETSNEELQATNEELMASNEELQSTNEELHSVNEELHTVSTEHETKIHELMETTEDLNQLLHSTSFGIVFLDPELHIRRFTDAATSMFNILPSDVGRPFQHLTYRFDSPDLMKEIETVRDTGQVFEREVTAGDRTFVLRVLQYASKVKTKPGVLLISVDISELRESQLERARTDARFAAVVHDLTDFVVRWDAKSHVIEYCNDVFASLFGKDPEDLVGTSIRNLGAAGRKLSIFTKLEKELHDSDFENVKLVSEGSIADTYVSGTVRPVYNEQGSIDVHQATGRNVSQDYYYRHGLESLIRAFESKAGEEQKVIDRILEIGREYFRMDRAMALRIVGKDAHIVTGVGTRPNGQKKVVPSNSILWSAVPKVDDVGACHDIGASNIASLTRFRKTAGSDTAIEAYIACKFETVDGTVGIVSFSSKSPRSEPFGEADNIFAKTLAQYVGQLMDRDDYIKEIATRSQELRFANDQLSTFAYVASHDLQEPVRKILQFSDMMNAEYKDFVSGDASYYMDTIRGSASKINTLVKDILAYTTASNAEMNIEQLSLKDIFSDIKKDLKDQLKERGGKLRINKMPDIDGDPAAVELLFQNLVTNAIKYTDPSVSPEVVVKTRRDNGATVIDVCDNGIGISGPKAEKVFSPFVRLHSQSKFSGTGIGLAVCKSICDRLGWSIDFNKNPKGGTIFSVTIPTKNIY